MPSISRLNRVSAPIRLVAIFVAGVLVAAAFMAGNHRPTRPPHYLGMRGLELAAFNGNAHLFLRLPPITANPSASHSTDIAASKFSLNLDNTPTAIGAAPSGAKISEIVIQKFLDKSSTKLFQAVASGTHFKTATIYILPAVQRDDEELEYILTGPIVSSDHTTASSDGTAETISLNFTKIQINYVRQNKVESSAQYTVPPAG
jgi:type VI secretion system secreted protein Hcp